MTENGILEALVGLIVLWQILIPICCTVLVLVGALGTLLYEHKASTKKDETDD